MRKTISLATGWTMGWSEFCGDKADPKTAKAIAKLEAKVPGDAHLDLMRAGILPDLYADMNADHALWMERKDWWYRCEFATPARSDGQAVMLIFHGLDTFAEIWLNGQRVGKTANMFLRHEFDVSPLLAASGNNELVVRLAAPAFSITVDPAHEHLIWSAERLFCRKAQMSFGWDIAPRLLTVGIWRPVELALVDCARLANVHITPIEFRKDDVLVRVEAEVTWSASTPGQAIVRGKVHDTPWSVTAPMTPGRNTVAAELLLKHPPLWWPIGYGSPSLIHADTVVEVAGREVDAFSCSTGLRRIELVREPQASGNGESFRFRCNGAEVFVTGLNWTPLDAIYARVTPERITSTLERLAGIGCNMLRVWGGGIYEPAHFYAECSRLGIMIWQDFMLACGWYPQTDAFASQLEIEARQVVRDLRGFPYMAIWAGDNEVDAFYPHLAAGNRLTRHTLASVCRELDPHVPYVPSSPWRPSGAKTTWISATEGDTHHYANNKHYREPESWDIRPLFMSEFGILSLPSLEVIRACFPADAEWPLTSPAWKYHGADTTRLGTFRGPDCILRTLAACGKPEPKTIEDAIVASQELQAEGMCAWIERYCENPEFGGFLIWNTTDCWPQMSSSVIDSMDIPKTILARLGPLFERIRKERATRAPKAGA